MSVTDGIFITPLEPGARGPRLAVKDLFDTAGVRTTYGSRIFVDHVPAQTALAVTRLEQAGYVSVGKTNLHEFAYGITSDNAHHGRVPNPLAADRIAGGSSGGNAAALAAGLADAALGTDSGGSIRIPSACCGTTGFKPTHGLVPITGCFPLAPTWDHAGPMARDVAGCAEMMAVLVPGFALPTPPDLHDLKVGTAWVEHCDALVAQRVSEATAHFADPAPAGLPLTYDTGALFGREVANVHFGLWREHADAYSDNVAHKVALAMEITDADADAAHAARERYRDTFDAAMGDLDLLITPTMALVAPPAALGEPAVRERMLQFTYPFNALGAPALALPCGPAQDGLPASVQIVGRPGADGLVLAAGLLLERALRVQA